MLINVSNKDVLLIVSTSHWFVGRITRKHFQQTNWAKLATVV